MGGTASIHVRGDPAENFSVRIVARRASCGRRGDHDRGSRDPRGKLPADPDDRLIVTKVTSPGHHWRLGGARLAGAWRDGGSDISRSRVRLGSMRLGSTIPIRPGKLGQGAAAQCRMWVNSATPVASPAGCPPASLTLIRRRQSRTLFLQSQPRRRTVHPSLADQLAETASRAYIGAIFSLKPKG
jgi:hypothetical protein